MIFGLLSKLGILGLPMAACFLAFCIIASERTWFFVRKSKNDVNEDEYMHMLRGVLSQYKDVEKYLREDIITYELEKTRREFLYGVGVLRFIGVVAPMIGLLGTMTGMIAVFASIATSTTSITPSLVAGGIEEVMYNTTFGLAIAIPSIAAHSLFSYIANSRIENYATVLNDMNFQIELKAQRSDVQKSDTKKAKSSGTKSKKTDATVSE